MQYGQYCQTGLDLHSTSVAPSWTVVSVTEEFLSSKGNQTASEGDIVLCPRCPWYHSLELACRHCLTGFAFGAEEGAMYQPSDHHGCLEELHNTVFVRDLESLCRAMLKPNLSSEYSECNLT